MRNSTAPSSRRSPTRTAPSCRLCRKASSRREARKFSTGSRSQASPRESTSTGSNTSRATAPKYPPTLSIPANDADDMAFALKKVGFDVIAVKNVDKRSLEKAMADFGRLAQEADAALVYYAGHGIQFQGLNYLMPVDARL